MIFFNPIVISEKIQHNNYVLKIKSFAASLAVHATLLTTAFYFSVQNPISVPLEEEPVLISLADYSPLSASEKYLNNAKNKPADRSSKTDKSVTSTHTPTPQKIPSSALAVSSEASAPQTSPVRPVVAPSDLQPPTQESLHSIQKPVANDSPHDTSSLNKTSELPKTNVSTEDINGATLGRIRAMIESSLTYPSIARKLRLEGTVTVSFILRPNGLVEKAEILSSSGSTLLDTKAIQTVLSLSGDYPTLPKTAYLKIPIAFSLTKS